MLNEAFAMVFVKSALVGLLALVTAFVLLLMVVMLGLAVYSIVHPPPDGAIGWDPVSLRSPISLVVALLIFCAGFFWEYRRLVHR